MTNFQIHGNFPQEIKGKLSLSPGRELSLNYSLLGSAPFPQWERLPDKQELETGGGPDPTSSLVTDILLGCTTQNDHPSDGFLCCLPID